MSLFSTGKYSTILPAVGKNRHVVIPDGAWVKCPCCGKTLYSDYLDDNLLVCVCGHHFAMAARERIKLLSDDGAFQEMDAQIASKDVLNFVDSKPYTARLQENEKKAGISEAVICGETALDGTHYFLGVMDFRFMGASMGAAVGEKITRLVEAATAARKPVVIVTASGGARMQEGILSLMQMAKTSGALERHSEAGLPYIAILTNPTYGGVTASFASLGDVILSEPRAMIGFAGPRVIQETTNAKLPPGFQTAEFLLEKGLVDRVVDRKNLRKELSQLLAFFQKQAKLS